MYSTSMNGLYANDARVGTIFIMEVDIEVVKSADSRHGKIYDSAYYLILSRY